MKFDKFTVKAQEAVQAAQSLAVEGSHQAIEPEHLLLALLQQQEGVVGPLLGGDPEHSGSWDSHAWNRLGQRLSVGGRDD